jgi:hypothetical protein
MADKESDRREGEYRARLGDIKAAEIAQPGGRPQAVIGEEAALHESRQRRDPQEDGVHEHAPRPV